MVRAGVVDEPLRAKSLVDEGVAAVDLVDVSPALAKPPDVEVVLTRPCCGLAPLPATRGLLRLNPRGSPARRGIHGSEISALTSCTVVVRVAMLTAAW